MAPRVGVDLRRNTWAPHYGISRVQRSLWQAIHDIGAQDLDVVGVDLRSGQLPGRRVEVGARHHFSARLAQEQWAIRRLAHRLDLLHLPWYEGPFRPPVRHVVTVHDLDTVDRPEGYRWRFRAYYNSLLRSYLRTATTILVPSQTTLGALEERWPGRRYELVYNGVDAVFRPDGETAPRSSDGPLIVYTGGFGARKRLPDLLDAFDALSAEQPDARLLVTGRPPPDVLTSIRTRRSTDRIVLRGYVSDTELAAWYRTADVVAYPSELEGFGLPVVEAFASGTPVVATTSGSVPEIAAGAARLVSARSPDALAGALLDVLGGGPDAAEMIRRGLIRARAFSWPAVARRTLDVYRAALAEA